jgi:hypothetical protein
MSWPNWNANAREREDNVGRFYKAIYMYIDTIKEKRIFKDYDDVDEQPTLLYRKWRTLQASYRAINQLQEEIEQIYMGRLTEGQKEYATVKEKWPKFKATKKRVEKLMSEWEALIMSTRESMRRLQSASRRNRSQTQRRRTARRRQA